MLAKNQYGDNVGSGYIINHKKRRLIFSAEKLPKCSSLFYHLTWVFNFDISFLKGKKSKSNNHFHRFQYLKILKSPINAAMFYLMSDKAYIHLEHTVWLGKISPSADHMINI